MATSIQKDAMAQRGGIDLTPASMHLQTKMSSGVSGMNTRLGGNDNGMAVQGNSGIRFHIDPAILAQLQNAQGFVPVIITIEPMTDLRGFLGVG
jgi:hypothetical protein